MKKYEINPDTLAIVGLSRDNCKVIESNNDYIIDNNAYSVMDNSCMYFGSTYNGRLKGSKNMLGNGYKLPIVVEESNNIIFFPINEIDDPNCIWISLKWFYKIEKINNINYILFKNGNKIPTTVSKYSIENQYLKSSKLNFILNERKNLKNN